MPLFAAQSRNEKPYPPMSKINDPSLLAEQFLGWPNPQNGIRIPKSAPQRKADFLEIEVSCAMGMGLRHTSLITICDVAGMRSVRDITAQNCTF